MPKLALMLEWTIPLEQVLTPILVVLPKEL
jgi:hypothetical protein